MAKNFTGARGSVVQRRVDLRTQATQLQTVTGSGITIPANVYASMQQQGMDVKDPWSPAQPIAPMMPLEQDPRQYEYLIGGNIATRPRHNESVSFDVMKSLIQNYDVAQLCISTRQDEIRNLEWDIVPEDEQVNQELYESEIKEMRKFFRKPDGTMLFDDWMNAHLYDLFAYDAPAFYIDRIRNGKIGALRQIDGTTFSPLVDYWGRLPKAPAPAFVQWIDGMPFWWGTQDNIVYRPFRRRNSTPYGLPPIEWLLMTINTDVRLQWHFLQYFTDGNVPDVFVNAPDGITDPKQIDALQTMYDTVMTGDQSQKHKVKMIPAGSKVQNVKENKFDVNFANWLMIKTCSGFGVQPAEIGMTEKVNKSSAESQENITYRRAIKPIAKYYEALFTDIIQNIFGYTNLRWKFLNVEEQEDKQMLANVDKIMIERGVYSPDWVAEQRFGIQVPDEEKVGRVFITSRAVVAVKDALAQSEAQTKALQAQAQASGMQQTNTDTAKPVEDDETNNDESTDPGGNASQDELKPLQTIKGASNDFFTKAGTETKPRSRKTIEKELQRVIADFLKEQGKIVAEHAAAYAYAMGALKKDAVDSTDASYQAQNIVDTILAQYNIPWDSLAQSVVQLLAESYVAGAIAADKQIIGAFDISYVNPIALDYAKNRGAELVGKGSNPTYSIADSTREWLNQAVTNAIETGLTPDQLRDSIANEYLFSDNRAWTIARTETAFSYNDGALGHAEKRGAEKVSVFDGDHDEDCQEADGQIWSIGYARANKIAHPNCVRNFSPDFSDTEPDKTDDDIEADAQAREEKKRVKKK